MEDSGNRQSQIANHKSLGLTTIVPTFNEESNILDCLASLSFADEILVVDSFSTDRTPELARSVPKVRFLQHAYEGNGPQCNWAMDQAASTDGHPGSSLPAPGAEPPAEFVKYPLDGGRVDGAEIVGLVIQKLSNLPHRTLKIALPRRWARTGWVL